MHILLDIIVVLIVVLTIIATYKKGFIKSALNLASLVLSILIISNFGNLITTAVYNVCFEKSVVSAVETTIKDQESVGEATIDEIFEALPPYISKTAKKSGIDNQSIITAMDSGESAHKIAVKVNEQVVEPIVLPIILILVDIVLFSILMFVFGYLSKLICTLFKAPILNQANKVLGAVMGVVKGIVISIFVCSIITFIIEYNNIKTIIFSKESINASYIFVRLAKVLNLTSFMS